MSVVKGLLLLVLGLLPGEGLAVGSPRLLRGDELVYTGVVEEASERVGNRFRKWHDLEVRLFVLETYTGYADCALMTRLRPRPDPVVGGAVTQVTGTDFSREPHPASIHIELARVDVRGRVLALNPTPGPPPIPIGPGTDAKPLAPLSIDTPPDLEIGLFVPLPTKPATVGTTWEMPDRNRPPVIWTAKGEALWNGGRCVEVNAVQQTDAWDRPEVSVTGWKRTDRILTNSSDGYACTVERKIEKRQGNAVIGWIEVKYELQPSTRYTGARYLDVRREAEMAYALSTELRPLLVKKTAVVEFQARLVKIDAFLKDHPQAGFREAVEAMRRRYAAAARGEAPPISSLRQPELARTEPPRLGQPAPDFVVPFVNAAGQFRLSAVRNKPAVLVFYKPDSETSVATLHVVETLHKKFREQATITALAIGVGPEEANRQCENLKLTIPILDGTAVRSTYAVQTYPRFYVVDATGTLTWQFDGYGPETGFLVKEQVEKLLPR